MKSVKKFIKTSWKQVRVDGPKSRARQHLASYGIFCTEHRLGVHLVGAPGQLDGEVHPAALVAHPADFQHSEYSRLLCYFRSQAGSYGLGRVSNRGKGAAPWTLPAFSCHCLQMALHFFWAAGLTAGQACSPQILLA